MNIPKDYMKLIENNLSSINNRLSYLEAQKSSKKIKNEDVLSSLEVLCIHKRTVYNGSFTVYVKLYSKLSNTKGNLVYKKTAMPEEKNIEMDIIPLARAKFYIQITHDILDALDNTLRDITYKLDMLIDINKDYSSYVKYQKKLVKNGYNIARLISDIYFTNFMDERGSHTQESLHVLVRAFAILENTNKHSV